MPSGIPDTAPVRLPRPWTRAAAGIALLGVVIAGCCWGFALLVPAIDGVQFAELRDALMLLGWLMAAWTVLLVAIALTRRTGRIAVSTTPPGLPTTSLATAGIVRLRPIHIIDPAEGGWWWHPIDRSDARRFTYALALSLIPIVIACVILVRPVGSFMGDLVLAGTLIAITTGGLLLRLPGQAARDASQPRLRRTDGDLTLVHGAGSTVIPPGAVLAIQLAPAGGLIPGLGSLAVALVWSLDGKPTTAVLAATTFGCGRLASLAADLAQRLGVPLVVV